MVEPQTIDHVIGQQNVVARFRVALEASWNDGTRLPHMLFTGPPGCGKTLLAHVAAREMGVRVHERLSQVVNCMGLLNRLLLQAEHKEVVFLDEAHELLPDVQTLLYRSMEGQRVSIRGRNETTLTMPIKDVTIICATTNEFKLLGPLRDRFKVVLPFLFYDADALATIVGQRTAMLGIRVAATVPRHVALRSRGTPRLAIRLLEACHRYARSRGDDEVTEQHFAQAVALEGIDDRGLGVDEQRYLRYLADSRGKAVRLTTLEAALGIHRRTLQEVVEPFLLREGLVERQAQGRVATEAGLRHLGLLCGPRVSVA
ncbi:MAG: Holliday junction DNA helicase RuvB C-terminal domain-containing protein [Planctomycetota bacterium]|jgi:Holliday junction DNA helicase RuvB